MSDIFQFLKGGSIGSYVESGIILPSSQDGKYSVSIKGKVVSAKSTIGSSGLVTGVRVIINRTTTGYFIIGKTRQVTSRTTKEIIING